MDENSRVVQKPVLTVVSTFYNDEQVIPELIQRLGRVLESLGEPYEILFVNDASTDRSLAIVIDSIKSDQRIKCVTTSRRFGIEACFMIGLEYAAGEAVVMIESDLQDPPEMIPELVKKWREGFSVVHTTRKSRLGESKFKLLATMIAYRIIQRFSDIHIPVDTGLFKLFSRPVVEKLIRLNEKDLYLRGLACWVGFQQTQIFYERQPRFAGKTHMRLLGDSLEALLSGTTAFSNRLLKLFLFLGVFSFMVLLAGTVGVVIAKIFNWPIPFFVLCIWFASLFFTVQMLTTGVLGLYIARIYREVQNRPRAIIDSKVGLFERK